MCIMDQTKNEGNTMEHSTNAVYYKLRLVIFIGTDGKGSNVYFGPGTQRLLHEIKNNGTIAKASENMKMAYSKCWKIIRNTENCLGFKLLERHTGRGNGSTLTPEGEDYLARYDRFVEEVTMLAEERFRYYFPDEP